MPAASMPCRRWGLQPPKPRVNPDLRRQFGQRIPRTTHALPLPSGPQASDPARRTWIIATSAAGGVAAVATAVPFVASFAPSERARAMGAAVEVDIGDIPPGGMKTVEWCGKLVWIVLRSAEMLAALQLPSPDLDDPNSKRD